MRVALRDYDFAAARRRLVARVDGTKRLVVDEDGKYNFDRTNMLRGVDGAADAVGTVQLWLVYALGMLPIAEGGLVRAGGTLSPEISADLPLVRALLILGSHPKHEDYESPAVVYGNAIPKEWPAFLAAHARPPWSLAALEAAVQEGVVAAYGDARVDPERTVDQAPGTKLNEYLRILAKTALLDAIGALEPSFTRADARAGEWWLLQPVSPRLNHEAVADKVGLELKGFLPPRHVDCEGRVVMVCFPHRAMSDDDRAELIAETKWIAGFDRVIWTKGHGPLADDAFELLEALEGVTESSYGPYEHSSELPPFPGPRKAVGPDGGVHAQRVAQAVLAALDAPEDPNAEALDAQRQARNRRILRASHLRSGVAPEPPRSFAGPARTVRELVFAASLERCQTCDDVIDPAAVVTRDAGEGSWEVAGRCVRCGMARSYRYAAAPDVERATSGPHELGAGPSRMIRATLFREALARALPLVAPEPKSLEEAEARAISSEANQRALVCLHELLKLDATEVERAADAAERDRQLALRAAHDAT